MPWVRLDDHIDQHPKIAALDDHAFALFVCGLAYCNRNLTDGFIPDQVGLGQLRFCDGNTVPAIRQLEAEGLWEEIEGGWRVHDYHDFQPRRTTVLRERRETAKRVTAYRHRNSSSNADGNAVTTPPTRTRTRTRTRNPVSVPDPVPGLSPNGEPATTPDVASLVDKFRALPGVTANTKKDGGLIAGLVGQYGADRVRQALDEVGVEIGAANEPRLFLAAVVRNPKPSAKPQTMRERAAELLARQQRIEGKGEAH